MRCLLEYVVYEQLNYSCEALLKIHCAVWRASKNEKNHISYGENVSKIQLSYHKYLILLLLVLYDFCSTTRATRISLQLIQCRVYCSNVATKCLHRIYRHDLEQPQ